ncbi:MAG: hypothetical protein ACLSAH_03680 [Bilophila wadsworthia]
MTTVEELADMAVFLLSPLSSHTTGQWVVVTAATRISTVP